MAFSEFKFVIAGGIPSSGSTLLSVMLDSHPDIFCGPETSLFHQPGIWRDHRMLHNLLKEDISGEGLPHDWLPWGRPAGDVLEYYGWSFGSLLDLAGRIHDMEEFIAAFYEESRKDRQEALVVDKTPQNIYAMDTCLSRFNDITAIVIVRHPVSVIDSLVRRGVHPKVAAAIWLYDASLIHALWKKYGGNDSERLLLIRYEEIVGAPEKTLSEVCRFLGVKNDVESMLSRKHTSRAENDPTLVPDEKSVVSKWNHSPLAGIDKSGMESIGFLKKHRESLDYLFTIRFNRSEITRYVSKGRPVQSFRLLADFDYGDITEKGRRDFKASEFVSDRMLTGYEKFYVLKITYRYDIKQCFNLVIKELTRVFRHAPHYCERSITLAKKTIKTTARAIKILLVPVVRYSRRTARTFKLLYNREEFPGLSIKVRSIVVPLPPHVDYDIVGVIALLGRHRILEVVIREVMKLNQYEGIRAGLVLACSNTVDAGFAQSIRAYYGDIGIVEIDNNPLGRKWQAAVNCARAASPEFLYITGSDDVITHDYILNNMRIMRDRRLGNITMCGPRTWYMTDLTKYRHDDALPVWKVSYRNSFHTMPLGAGRIYPAGFLDSIDWRIFEPGLDKLLDDRGYNLVYSRKGNIYIPTLDDGFVLSVKGNWNALNAVDSILSADSIAACEVEDSELGQISASLSHTWNDIIELAKQG